MRDDASTAERHCRSGSSVLLLVPSVRRAQALGKDESMRTHVRSKKFTLTLLANPTNFTQRCNSYDNLFYAYAATLKGTITMLNANSCWLLAWSLFGCWMLFLRAIEQQGIATVTTRSAALLTIARGTASGLAYNIAWQVVDGNRGSFC